MAGCCKSKSTCILFTVNLLLLVVGVLVTTVGGVTKAHRQEILEKFPDYNEVFPAVSADLALAGGVLLLFLSLVGLVGAAKYESCCGKLFLVVYILLLVLIMVVELVAVAVVFALAGRLSDFANNHHDAAGVIDQFDESVSNFTMDVYTKCCADQKPQPQAEGCTFISSILNDQSCATEGDFKQKLLSLVTSRLHTVGITALVVAIVQLFTLCASCCLLCRGKDKSEEQKQALNRQQQQQQNGQYYNQQQQQGQPGGYQAPAAGNAVSYA